ncbi:MAG TPA: hypothetical protein VLE74_02610 [Candidatus Saccharimonadales bacterium]|nr:hypothetical protein [Candidatus Saccharimonadales bacterium]
MAEIDPSTIPERCLGCLRPAEKLVDIDQQLLVASDLRSSLDSKMEALQREHGGVVDAIGFYRSKLEKLHADDEDAIRATYKRFREKEDRLADVEASQRQLPLDYGQRLAGFDGRREQFLQVHADAFVAAAQHCPGRPNSNAPCGLESFRVNDPASRPAEQASRLVLEQLVNIRL